MNLLERGSGAFGDFVDVLRQVRTDEIAAEAARHIQIAVVGVPGAGKTTLIRRLAGGALGGLLEPFALRRFVELELPLSAEAFEAAAGCDLALHVQDVSRPYAGDDVRRLRAAVPAFVQVANKADLLVDPAPMPEDVALISAESSASVRDVLIPAILDAASDLGLALGRQLSLFREPVALREIARVARVNAEVAVVSAIPQASLILGPASVVADTVLLTKNQAMLVMRLAAMYGLDLDRRRLTELAPVVGAAFGWRTLARELVGFLPAGLGVVPKAAIAYAGTVAVGRAALWYYQTGRSMPRAQLRQIYAESAARAKDVVRKLRRAG